MASLYQIPKGDKPLPNLSRCICSRAFKPEHDMETYCSKECAREDSIRALMGEDNLYRRKAKARPHPPIPPAKDPRCLGLQQTRPFPAVATPPLRPILHKPMHGQPKVYGFDHTRAHLDRPLPSKPVPSSSRSPAVYPRREKSKVPANSGPRGNKKALRKSASMSFLSDVPVVVPIPFTPYHHGPPKVTPSIFHNAVQFYPSVVAPHIQHLGNSSDQGFKYTQSHAKSRPRLRSDIPEDVKLDEDDIARDTVWWARKELREVDDGYDRTSFFRERLARQTPGWSTPYV